MIRGNVSVRKLAEFVYRSGDLYPSRTGVAVEPDEGIAAQHAAQRKREQANTHYQREVAVQCTFTVDGEQRLLAGQESAWSELEPAHDATGASDDTEEIDEALEAALDRARAEAFDAE